MSSSAPKWGDNAAKQSSVERVRCFMPTILMQRTRKPLRASLRISARAYLTASTEIGKRPFPFFEIVDDGCNTNGMIYKMKLTIQTDLRMRKVLPILIAIATSMLASQSVRAVTSTLIAEENFEGGMNCQLASKGNFPVEPGIKSGMGINGSCAYGFGRSSCPYNAWDGYVNDLVFTFTRKYVITRVEFWEIERYGNWGSQGWLIANGVKLEDTSFARLPSNDNQADSGFRKREFSLNVVASSLTFRCWDITDVSELFIDNIRIYGYAENASVDVVLNFTKGATELNPSCDNAYWVCKDTNEYTAFPIMTGDAYAMHPGTYTLYLYSGESEFADPDPITITIDGTENRIEREVLLQRKKVKFNCIFYNTVQKDYGILPNSLGLNSYCTWRIDGGEWHTPGQSVEIVTGTHNLELNINESIRLMARTDILSTPITVDGSKTEHTEYINVLGANGAKVKFNFSIMNSITASVNFNKSLVDVTLRNSLGDTMTVPAGEYCLPKGDYVASFSYGNSESDGVLWRAPEDIEFSVNGRDREFNLLFVDIESAPLDWTTAIWFDATDGESEATVLRYIQPTYYNYIFGSMPEARRDGHVFLGWFSKKSGGRKFTKDSFVPRYDDSEIEYVDVDNERRIHLYAHWKKTNMTPSWLSAFSTIFEASNGDVEYAGAMTAANGKMTVSDCFDVGVNPQDPTDDFRIAEFKMENGNPVFTFNHTEDGAGNSFESKIKIIGAKSLGAESSWDNFSEVSAMDKSEYKFFKAMVEQD